MIGRRAPRLHLRLRNLQVPALPRLFVDHPDETHVFDAWSWCASDVLTWAMPPEVDALDLSLSVESENPPELLFVFREDEPSVPLPCELARLHASRYGFVDEWTLAPYAIDDATDQLYEHRRRPRDVFWMAASSLRAVVWGLHDWAHFHNHGPFEEPARTELQCDLVALAWLRGNRELLRLSDEHIERVRRELVALSETRFASEAKTPPVRDLDALFATDYETLARND